jgi:hypothetical protein
MPQFPQLVIGLGTGRCGTQSLAVVLNRQDGARVTHERYGAIAWQGDEERVAAFVRLSATSPGLDLAGDVGFYYLPYVEQILAIVPNASFICLKRDRKATVDSYLTKTPRKNHWTQHNGVEWRFDAWDRCYPKYAADDKAEAIGLYWDDYYHRAAALETAHPAAFRVFSTESLNTAPGQQAVFDFIGLPARARRVILDVRENRSPPPRAVGFFRRCARLLKPGVAVRRAA